jgi:RNase H-fold protein (predicted Holliday junction resolvase)
MRRSRRRETVDGVAAALMLQGWLDARRVHTGTTAR